MQITTIIEGSSDWTMAAEAARRWAAVESGDWDLIGLYNATDIVMGEAWAEVFGDYDADS